MCFVNDGYDWTAAICEESDATATRPYKCLECGSVIAVGEFIHHVHQQEYEDCQFCEDDYCGCETPDFGETFDWHWCENCDKFLRAIKQAELDDGCSESESRPAMPFWEDIQNIGSDGAKRYWVVARRMFPEIGAYLDRLWVKMFGDDEAAKALGVEK